MLQSGRRLRWQILLPVALAVLGGCAPEPYNIDSAALQQPGAPRRNVCVLSVVGQVFAVQKVGLTMFGNEHAATSIAAWNIDDFVAKEIAAVARGNVNVRSIPVSIADPASVREFNVHTRGPFTKDNPAWEAAKRRASADKSCDLLVTVTAGFSKVSSTNQAVSGIGMLETPGVLAVPGKTFVHALMDLYLYDARTMQQLSWAGGWRRYAPMVDFLRGPNRQVDESWRIELAAVAASRRHREAVEGVVREGLADLVPRVLSFAAGKASRPSAEAAGVPKL